MSEKRAEVVSLHSDDASEWNERMRRSPYWDVDVAPLEDRAAVSSRSVALDGTFLVDAAVRGGAKLIRDRQQVLAGAANVAFALITISEGCSAVRMNGHEVTLRPGRLYLLPGDIPFEQRMSPDYRDLKMLIDADVAATRLEGAVRFERPLAVPYEGAAAVLGAHVSSLIDHAAAMAPEDGLHATRSVLSLVGAAFAGRREDDTKDAVRDVQRRRVKVTALERLADPDLDATSLAEAHGMSVRYLHALFEHTDETIMAWVRARRLERCREALTRTDLAHLSICEIAFRWGFNSASHFSRAFRSHFGVTPSAVRTGRATQKVS